MTPGGLDLEGTGVSPGIAEGRALVVERLVRPVFRLAIEPGQVEAEVARLALAVGASRAQLLAIKERLSREVGLPHAYIFDAHLLMLDDPLLLDRGIAIIREEHVNSEWALRSVSEQLHALFDEFEDAYLRERSTDLDDVLGRIQLNLAGGEGAPSLARLPGRFVLVAEELGPSEAAELDWRCVLGIAVDGGSRTSHTAILARSLGIPAVVGLKDATRRVRPGALTIVDGTRGRIVVEPSAPALHRFRAEREQDRLEERRLQGTRGLAAVTLDGERVLLQANVEFPEEVATAATYGAEGIGLFRTEYLLGAARRWPSEEQQIEVYRRLLEQMSPHPVTLRTWDVGPEDLGPVGPTSANPALGERALRLVHRDAEPFRVQLRALLRAAAYGPLRIMLPFVSGPADLRQALDLVEEARASLRRDRLAFDEHVPVGVNLEIPSAALTADLLARDVDFFSIGTNDLIQYLLAVDRGDPRLQPLFQPLHPAVLRTLDGVLSAARAQAVPISACGEMAAEPVTALLLIGLGLRELSMTPASIPRIKAVLRRVSAAQARRAAAACLSLSTAAEIEEALRRELAEALRPAPLTKE